MDEILSGKAVAYARWCLPVVNRKVPHYVRLQAEQWLEIVEGRNPEARIDEGKYRKICKLLRVMNHPDLGCSLYDGLKAMLKSAGYRMEIQYDQETRKVVVSAVPIVDYSAEIEYSSDMNADYSMKLDRTGVNHLICLGSGELKDRIVEHLYVDGDGNISQTQTFFDENEIAETYDYAGASREDLIQSGAEQLKGDIARNEFRIVLESEREVAVGYIVGARDYITGYTVTAPITTKIIKCEEGFVDIEYKLSNDVEIEQIPAMMMALAVSPDSEEAEASQEEEEDET